MELSPSIEFKGDVKMSIIYMTVFLSIRADE